MVNAVEGLGAEGYADAPEYFPFKHKFMYSTPRGKTDKLEEPVNRKLDITRS